MLNIVLLVTSICIVVALILYLFYWQRVVGYIFGLTARLFFWSQGEWSVWIDVGAIHVSILAGRISFKDLRYYSSNQTIKVVKGQISWRYWIRRPAEEEDLHHAQLVGEETNGGKDASLSCRIHMSVQGLEWFIYNRMAAFDSIASDLVSELSPATPSPTPARFSNEGARSIRKIFSRTSGAHDASLFGPPMSLMSSIYNRTPSALKKVATWVRDQLPNFDLKSLLPISVEATKGAIILGNASTPSLLVAEFSVAEGTYGIVQARSKCDQYRQLLNVKFRTASLAFVDNADYKSPASKVGQDVHEHLNKSRERPLKQSSYLAYFPFERLWDDLKLWSVTSESRPRTRLFTYLAVLMPHLPSRWPWFRRRKRNEEETPVGANFAVLEYAIDRKILETPQLDLVYYADVVGLVPPGAQNTSSLDVGNGDSDPEWGMDIVIRSGYIRYGPWADRQRVPLQHTFFPQSYRNSEPVPRLKPGDMRMWTALKIFVELREGVTLHIPFREASKDWQWDGQVEVPNRPRKREPASIHVTAGDSSTITYVVPMIAGPTGYESVSEVHLDTVTVTSSLNDIRLVTADSCRLHCYLPSPLNWNTEREWTFSVALRQASLFLLRDHINMLTDLGKDWSAGPPGNYHRFIPMLYTIRIDLQQHYDLNLYVNDHNIIDKPSIKEENALLTLRGTSVQGSLQIPFLKFSPVATTVSFKLDVPAIAVNLSLPKWNIQSQYPTPNRTSLGTVGCMSIGGSYEFFSEVRDDNVERLTLDIAVRDIAYKAFGWSVRHFMVLRDNYFGSFTHFSTLYEYLKKRREGHAVGDPIELQYREGASNPLEVQLAVDIHNVLFVLPVGIPGYESYTEHSTSSADTNDLGSCVVLNAPEIQVHLRTNDYYMDMSLNTDSITGRIEDHCTDILLARWLSPTNEKACLVVDELDITAHRLFGPRPRSATYVCVWEIHVGHIRGVVTTEQGQLLSMAGTSFGLNFTDALNAPAEEFIIFLDPDVTFLKVALDGAILAWHAGNVVTEVELPGGVEYDSNDLAGQHYRKVSSLRIPEVSVKLLLASRSTRFSWYEASQMRFDVNLDMYSAPDGWQASAQEQLRFISKQDRLSGRVRFLYQDDLQSSNDNALPHGMHLPHLRIPTTSRQPQKPYLKASQHAVRRAMSTTTTHRSESDCDEGISEAARDARVADSRPAQPLVDGALSNPDDSLYSNEESDDDDVTDDQEWDSDSDIVNDGSDSYAAMSGGGWHRLVKRFSATHLSQPFLWRRSPFTLIRDKVQLLRVRTGSASKDKGGKSCVPPRHSFTNRDKADVDIRVYRLISEKSVDIYITPLVVAAVDDLCREMSETELPPELRLDAILASFIQADPAQHSESKSRSIFEAWVTTARLTLVQPVESKTSEGVHVPSPQKSSSGTTVATVNVSLCGCHARVEVADNGKVSPSSEDLLCSFQEASVTTHRDQLAGTRFRPAPQAVCSLNALAGLLQLLDNELSISLHEVILDATHDSPELLFFTAKSTYECARVLTQSYQKMSSRVPAAHRLIYQILLDSRDTPVIHPLSTIQPSYLVQRGRPDAVRRSTSFKFLTYLRTCLRHIDKLAPLLVNADPPDCSTISLEEVVHSADNQYLNLWLDDDVSSLSKEPFLQKLFGTSCPVGEPQSDNGRSRALPCSINLHTLFLSIIHPSGDLRSQLCLDKGTLAFRPDEIQLLQPFMGGKTAPNATGDRDHSGLQRVTAALCLDELVITVYPQLMNFVNMILRAQRQFLGSKGLQKPAHIPSSLPIRPHSVYVHATLLLRKARLKAAADKLVMLYTIGGLSYTSSSFLQANLLAENFSTTQSLVFEEMCLRACSASDTARHDDHASLASLTFLGGKVVCTFSRDHSRFSAVKLILGGKTVELSVPRSALRLYRFIEEWRADYLPGIVAAAEELLTELRESPNQPAASSATGIKNTRPPRVLVQAHLSSLRTTLQVMRGTWLSSEISQMVALVESSSHNGGTVYTFGLQAGPHRFGIPARRQAKHPRVGHHLPHEMQLKVDLPTASVKGTYNEEGIRGLALIDRFDFTLRASDLDTLLSVQQKSEQDFNDLIHLVEESRRTSGDTVSRPQPRRIGRISGSFRMKGFRVGVEGISSVLSLECDDINGEAENKPVTSWRMKLSDLALSLAPSSAMGTVPRDHRSAFVSIDFKAEMGETSDAVPEVPLQRLEVAVTKVHAVMHPTSVAQLGDLVDHLQAEILLRKEERANELAQFKDKARSIMRSLDVKTGDAQTSQSSWLDQHAVLLSIKNIGFAFPLTLDHDVDMPHRSHNRESVKAFIFSIQSLSFGTQRGETGQATMKGFAFQFVPRFRQWVPEDFAGDNHRNCNRLLYPEMTAHLQSKRLDGSRCLRIRADVSGFVLDLDPTIPDYVFSLIHVYHEGRARMERFATQIPRSSPASKPSPQSTGFPEPSSSASTTNILLSLVFASGQIRAHTTLQEEDIARSWQQHSRHPLGGSGASEGGVEVFRLPVVSVGGEYRAKSLLQKVQTEDRAHSILMFKATIYSSQNILRPTLLPFITELVDRVEQQFHRETIDRPPSTPSAHERLLSLPAEHAESALQSASGMKISLTLRIDQSKLELTCQPDVNVIAGVNWQSGGFVVNISPGFQRVNFTASVAGLTIGLKHGFLSDDCVRLDMRNLAFNASFAKAGSQQEQSPGSISMVLDTELSGGVRFSRLQDVLCFKAVWLDRIPVLSALAADTSEDAPSPVKSKHPEKPTVNGAFPTAVVLRLRQIQLDVDLGQSISLVRWKVDNMLVRSKLTGEGSELSVSLAELSISASGNISGRATTPNFLFRSVRVAEGSVGRTGRMLDIVMTSGGLVLELDSEYQKLIQYRSEPVEVTIYDDWSKLTSRIPESERRVEVAFTVSGTEVVIVMNVGTIPRLLSYANKFMVNLDAQRDGASRESQAFRIVNSPKPDNPLSAVANAMLQSTRSRLKEADTSLPFVIRQRLSLSLDTLQLVVFPRAMRDPELAQFIGRSVHARLDRLVEDEATPAMRHLQLSIASITTSRIYQLNHSLVAKEAARDAKHWLSMLVKDAPEAIIFGLPAMDISMRSRENVQDDKIILRYDFSSKFGVREGKSTHSSEDIYVTLNMSLYSWLTVLRKTLAREMEQVNAAADIRAGPGASIPPNIATRRKALDPLVIPSHTDVLTASPEPLEGSRPPRGSTFLPHARSTPSLPLGSGSPDGARPLSPDLSPFASRESARPLSPSLLPYSPILAATPSEGASTPLPAKPPKTTNIVYEPHDRHIERLTMRQLGEATPDVMHPFFMKKAGFSLEDSLPQYVHEYATVPTESIMKGLLKVYSKQLNVDRMSQTSL